MGPGIVKSPMHHSEILGNMGSRHFHSENFTILFSLDILETEISFQDLPLPKKRISLVYDGSDFFISTSPGVGFSQKSLFFEEPMLHGVRQLNIVMGRPHRGNLLIFDDAEINIIKGNCLMRSMLSAESGSLAWSSKRDYERVSSLLQSGFRIPVMDDPTIILGHSGGVMVHHIKIKVGDLEFPEFKKIK
jgi:hypothetical protein